jgi:hypothetical protein
MPCFKRRSLAGRATFLGAGWQRRHALSITNLFAAVQRSSSRRKKQKQQPQSTAKHTGTNVRRFGASARIRVAAVSTKALAGTFAEFTFTEGDYG